MNNPNERVTPKQRKPKKAQEPQAFSNSFPKPLSKEEEASNLHQYANGNGKEREIAKNTLIERNMRLVAHIAKKFHHQSSDQEDLISIGTIGLIKGIYSFKPEKGTRLATYVSRCIENGIYFHVTPF